MFDSIVINMSNLSISDECIDRNTMGCISLDSGMSLKRYLTCRDWMRTEPTRDEPSKVEVK